MPPPAPPRHPLGATQADPNPRRRLRPLLPSLPPRRCRPPPPGKVPPWVAAAGRISLACPLSLLPSPSSRYSKTLGWAAVGGVASSRRQLGVFPREVGTARWVGALPLLAHGARCAGGSPGPDLGLAGLLDLVGGRSPGAVAATFLLGGHGRGPRWPPRPTRVPRACCPRTRCPVLGRVGSWSRTGDRDQGVWATVTSASCVW